MPRVACPSGRVRAHARVRSLSPKAHVLGGSAKKSTSAVCNAGGRDLPPRVPAKTAAHAAFCASESAMPASVSTYAYDRAARRVSAANQVTTEA